MKRESIARLSEARILVIGDWMLDVWVEGTAERLSPEAPVPVFLEERRWMSSGGAGNMVTCAEALGCCVTWSELNRDPSRPGRCPLRTRYRVGGHQLLRVDDDSVLAVPVTERMEREYCDRIASAAVDADIIAISDYGHGAVSRRVIEMAVATNKRVIVDPARSARAELYEGVSVIKPNQAELCTLVDGIDDDDRVQELGFSTGAAVVATLGARGMLVAGTSQIREVPGYGVPVADVTGAGDAAMAALCASIAVGLDLFEAAEIANLAASIAVSKCGTAAVSAWELTKAFDAL